MASGSAIAGWKTPGLSCTSSHEAGRSSSPVSKTASSSLVLGRLALVAARILCGMCWRGVADLPPLIPRRLGA